MWLGSMLVVYGCATAAAIFLLRRRSPDTAQLVAMVMLAVAFFLLSLSTAATLLNGHNPLGVWQLGVHQSGRDLMGTAVLVILGRLLWKEWICGVPPRS